MNSKCLYRLYREQDLQPCNKIPKRRDDRTLATQVNQACAMDFLHDQVVTNRYKLTGLNLGT